MPDIFRGLIIPFIGTTAGAAMVFLLRDQLTEKVQKSLTGFAAGVMVAASFWSLLAPALEEAENMGKFAFVPAAVGSAWDSFCCWMSLRRICIWTMKKRARKAA